MGNGKKGMALLIEYKIRFVKFVIWIVIIFFCISICLFISSSSNSDVIFTKNFDQIHSWLFGSTIDQHAITVCWFKAYTFSLLHSNINFGWFFTEIKSNFQSNLFVSTEYESHFQEFPIITVLKLYWWLEFTFHYMNFRQFLTEYLGKGTYFHANNKLLFYSKNNEIIFGIIFRNHSAPEICVFSFKSEVEKEHRWNQQFCAGNAPRVLPNEWLIVSWI